MSADHTAEIDAALQTLVQIRREQVRQIRQNASNSAARQNLIEIQTTIDALVRARRDEEMQTSTRTDR